MEKKFTLKLAQRDHSSAFSTSQFEPESSVQSPSPLLEVCFDLQEEKGRTVSLHPLPPELESHYQAARKDLSSIIFMTIPCPSVRNVTYGPIREQGRYYHSKSQIVVGDNIIYNAQRGDLALFRIVIFHEYGHAFYAVQYKVGIETIISNTRTPKLEVFSLAVNEAFALWIEHGIDPTNNLKEEDTEGLEGFADVELLKAMYASLKSTGKEKGILYVLDHFHQIAGEELTLRTGVSG